MSERHNDSAHVFAYVAWVCVMILAIAALFHLDRINAIEAALQRAGIEIEEAP